MSASFLYPLFQANIFCRVSPKEVIISSAHPLRGLVYLQGLDQKWLLQLSVRQEILLLVHSLSVAPISLSILPYPLDPSFLLLHQLPVGWGTNGYHI